MSQKTLSQNEKVVFCLARGYPNKEAYRYGKLIIRNILLRRALGKESRNWDFIVFHEGNFTKPQQKLISFLSLNQRIKYKSVEDLFVIPADFSSSELTSNVGYILMCRFNYLQIWDLISTYSVAMRTDDDVFLFRFNAQIQGKVFDYALTSAESHAETNETLPIFLKEIGIHTSYNQIFPYTNFYITKTDFWQKAEVRNLIESIGRQKIGFKNRWGDLPIIGTVLNEFAKAEDNVLRRDITYYHSSHRTFVHQGKNTTVKVFFKMKLKETLIRFKSN